MSSYSYYKSPRRQKFRCDFKNGINNNLDKFETHNKSILKIIFFTFCGLPHCVILECQCSDFWVNDTKGHIFVH